MTKTWLKALLIPLCAGLLLPACDDDDDDAPPGTLSPTAKIVLGFLGRYHAGVFDDGAAEIPAFDPTTDRIFVVNGGTNSVDILNAANPAAPALLASISMTPYGGGAADANGSATSVAIKNGFLAIAVERGSLGADPDPRQQPGQVVIFNSNDDPLTGFVSPLAVYDVGALPDMVCFTPNGNFILTANEGEPALDYSPDPEGSVSIINITGGVATGTVATASFASFNGQKAALQAQGVRIYGNNGLATVAQDFEPEYVAVSANSATAWVTLQENNALAIVNIATATVTSIVPLGFKDWNLPAQKFDPQDNLAAIGLVNGPIRGMYQPDAIAAFEIGGATYLITANEGDVREWTAPNNEIARLSTRTLDPTAFPTAAALQAAASFGRLNVTTKSGDTDGDGDLDQIYAFGARSFTIWNSAGLKVWDSGDALERIAAAAFPLFFNASNTNNTLDNRSDDKGPEPEGVAIGVINNRTYAFVCLERIGGVVVYDVTTPSAPEFQQYINTRDFSATPASPAVPGPGAVVPGLDLGPEGLVFVPAADSPTNEALLIVANEISGSTVIYKVTQLFGN